MNITSVSEDDNYYAIELEKVAFLNVKQNIQQAYKGATLSFINSSAKLVFYRKENS